MVAATTPLNNKYVLIRSRLINSLTSRAIMVDRKNNKVMRVLTLRTKSCASIENVFWKIRKVINLSGLSKRMWLKNLTNSKTAQVTKVSALQTTRVLIMIIQTKIFPICKVNKCNKILKNRESIINSFSPKLLEILGAKEGPVAAATFFIYQGLAISLIKI